MQVGQKIYQQPGATQTEQKSDDWVVDGEVEGESNTTRV